MNHGNVELGNGAGLGRVGSRGGAEYSNTAGKVWSVYLNEAEKQDTALAENWKGDAEGILIFTGLFAATVAAFIIESYKQLSSDPSAATVQLLGQISQQISALSNGTQIAAPPPFSDASFRPTSSAIRVNILWFLSLILSLICALAATLMQQWARRYLQLAQSQTALHKRARTRAYLYEGVQTFRLSQAVEAVPAVLHVSVFLFFAGLVDFLFSIDGVVAHAMFGVVVFFGAIYLLLTFLPNVRPNCPYRTPFSRDALKWLLFSPTAPVLLALAGMNQLVHSERFARVHMRFHIFVQSSLWSMSDAIRAHQKEIEWRALLWTTATVDDDDEIEAFVEGIPGYVMSGTSKGALTIVEDLIHSRRPSPFGRHLEHLLMTCIPEDYRSASELVRRRRSIICLDTARFLTGIYFASFSYSMFGFQTWRAVNSLKRDEDPVVAINAVATGALAARAYLRAIFIGGEQEPEPAQTPQEHVTILAELVAAPWLQDGAALPSFAGCHLLVLHGLLVGLLPHMRAEDVAPASFRAVWETLPRLISKTPHDALPERPLRAAFLARWAEAEDLAGRTAPDIRWESVMVSGSEPPRFKRRVMDADVMPPIVQFMSMLRPIAEALRAADPVDTNVTSAGPTVPQQVLEQADQERPLSADVSLTTGTP
ncbi:hypothetical protein EDB84DRAFT_1488240 [Lactarius hengduanensis]|nr:hypothetical protein EDB84DRAFT_1488240 [Lactarius hengduanensis]